MLNSCYFIGSIQTLLITLIFFLYKSQKFKLNRYLGFFFLTLFIETVKIILLRTYHNIQLFFLPVNFNFLTIVFLFFYASETSGVIIKNKFKYYIMAIIEALLFSMLFILVWLFPSLIEKLFIYGFMDVYMISSSIFVGYFCIRIIKINLTHKNKLLQFYEDVKYKTLLWLSAFCVICIVLNFLGFLGRFLFLNSENYHVLTEVLFLISLYYITIASLVQINISNVINTSKVSLNEIQQELVEVCKTIDYYMANEKLYLNPSLNLSFLSNYIKIPDRLISKSINEIKNKNFNRFVHEYRIEEFKRLILDKKYDKYSIEALAHEIGYNSRASFYKNFKTIVGVSPHDYIENVKINKE